jgi:mannose-1-phosphate guanylyltransferase
MSKARVFTIVMAGGSGTRFWPLSRADRPKQLLPLAGTDEVLLAATVRRATRSCAAEDVLVVTSERLAAATRAALPALPPGNVLEEPVGRNTAPCIAWAASRVARVDPDAVCVVLPADHHIGNEDEYAATLERAIEAAEGGEIVTVGIRPSRPETGYGYIEMGEALADGVHRARRFVEKPNRQRAEQFLAAGTYLWNSGMFFFRAKAILDAVRTHLPALGAAVDQLLAADTADEPELARALYPTLPDVSIDHGVMEKVRDVAVVPAEFGWSDLGGFATAWELASCDAARNSAPEGAVLVDASGCFVRAPRGKVVALVGVKDLVVIDTEDALLVVPREQAQDVKKVVAELKRRGDEEHL